MTWDGNYLWLPEWVYWTMLILDAAAGYVVLASIARWVLVNVWGWARMSPAGTRLTDAQAGDEMGGCFFTIIAPLTLLFGAFWWLWRHVQRALDGTQEKKPPKQEVE